MTSARKSEFPQLPVHLEKEMKNERSEGGT